MDHTTRVLAAGVEALEPRLMSGQAKHETCKRVIDAVACAIGGYHSRPAGIARALAGRCHGVPSARLIGSGRATSMEMAAFANSVMVRYLDYNDTYVSTGGGHPSDMIAAVLAVGEAHRAPGSDVLAAIAAAYEVFAALADAVPISRKGWDQGIFVVLGSAAGAGRILGLSREQLENALSIAVSANIPTRQARSGELSMWKGCATAAAARAGVFAALLAKEGMTGPTAPFEGRHGVWEQVTGPFQLKPVADRDRVLAVERTNLKCFPSEYHSQAPIGMMLAIRRKLGAADVREVNVRTYHMAYSEIGSDPEKWDPRTRETADHSLPYLLAVALRDGAVTAASFTPERISDPALRPLMSRISVAEDPEFTRQYPGALLCEVEVVATSGERFVERASYPKGHFNNPMTDREVEGKFVEMTSAWLPAGQRTACLEALWNLAEFDDIGALMGLLTVADLPD